MFQSIISYIIDKIIPDFDILLDLSDINLDEYMFNRYNR